MQPSSTGSRRIVRDLRPDGPLVYERLSDPILVRRAKDGDRQALATLCERHAPRVERIALHVLRDPEDARDAAQESLVKLVQRVGQFKGQSQFSTWLHRLVVNTCKDVAQARWAATRRTEPLYEDARIAADGDPARALAESEARLELGRCLAELPAAQAPGRRAAGCLRRPVRRDLGRHRTARRHREVLRPPRAQRPPRAAVRVTDVVMDKAAIEAVLPHRDPMLLIDEVTELVPGERVVARKTVTEEDCAGHFPGNPIMPGVKMVEALAQCGAVAVLSQEENRGKLALFAGIDDVRFKRVVRPGDVLTLECVVETVRGPVGRGKVKATVEGQLAVRGTLTFAVGDGGGEASA